METCRILLPQTLYVLRDKPHQTIKTDSEEYNIYFANVIHPLLPGDDVVVNCAYGRNYGDRWCITEFPYDVDAFPLEIVVYDAWGRRRGEKSLTVRLQNKKRPETPLRVLCFGDSMTRSQLYMEHIAMKLYNVRFVGTRSYNGTIRHEGRGGWSFDTYRTRSNRPFCSPRGQRAAPTRAARPSGRRWPTPSTTATVLMASTPTPSLLERPSCGRES